MVVVFFPSSSSRPDGGGGGGGVALIRPFPLPPPPIARLWGGGKKKGLFLSICLPGIGGEGRRRRGGPRRPQRRRIKLRLLQTCMGEGGGRREKFACSQDSTEGAGGKLLIPDFLGKSGVIYNLIRKKLTFGMKTR